MTIAAVADAEPPIFEALLTPHRSLSRRGVTVVFALLGAVSLFVGVGFLANGAWPVVGFFGLDVLVLGIAFRASFRSARAREEVRVSRSELLIRHTSPRGRVREESYNPFWTRLSVRREPEVGVTRVTVAAKGRASEVGAFLNPGDRESFATEFSRALALARR